jgi:hypothetical protein
MLAFPTNTPIHVDDEFEDLHVHVYKYMTNID